MGNSTAADARFRNDRGLLILLAVELGIPAAVNHLVFEQGWIRFGVALAFWIAFVSLASAILAGFKAADTGKMMTLFGFFWTVPAMIMILLVASFVVPE